MSARIFTFGRTGVVTLLALLCAIVIYNCSGGGGGGGTTSVNVDREGRFSIEVSASPAAIAPGEVVYLTVTLISHYSLGISIRLRDTCPEYFTCPDIDPGPRDGITLRAHDTETLQLKILSAPNTPAGSYKISVSATKNTSGGGTPISESDSAVVEVGPIDPGEAPVVTITSHTDQQELSGRAIVIHGTASDPDGVRRVEINGHGVESSDGYATWSIKLPLETGPNTFVAATTDALNFSNMEAATLSVYNTKVFLSNPVDLAIDEARQQLLVTDIGIGALIAFDLDKGSARMVSGPGKPNNALPFIYPTLLAVDSANDQAWVLDSGYKGLLKVDLNTGKRSRIPASEEDLPITIFGSNSKRPFHLPLDMIFNPDGNNVLVLLQILNPTGVTSPDYQIQTNRIIAVDPDTGERYIFADETTPDEEFPVYESNRMVFDPAGQRVIVTNESSSAGVYQIDPVTGERSVFVAGLGLNPSDLEFAPGDSTLMVLSHRQMGALDMASGEYSALWTSDYYYRASRMAIDPWSNRILILFRDSSDVGAVNLATGEERIFISNK